MPPSIAQIQLAYHDKKKHISVFRETDVSCRWTLVGVLYMSSKYYPKEKTSGLISLLHW